MDNPLRGLRFACILSVIAVIFIGCTSRSNSLFLLLDEINGTAVGQPVEINGHTVGRVSDIGLNADYRILITLSLNYGIRIPVDSRIVADNGQLFNTGIEIEPGVSDIYFNKGDTVVAQRSDSKDEIENLIRSIQNLPDKLDSAKRSEADTLLSELKKLNQNLDKLLN